MGKYKICGNCSAVYLIKLPSEKHMSAVSESDADERIDNPDDKHSRAVFKTRIAKLKKYYQKAPLLDVGAGNGLFLEIAKENSFRVLGLEKSKKLVSYLNEQRGIKTVSNFRQLKAKKFEVITTFDVLEHITRPNTFLNNIRKHMKKDGILMINVPNAGGISAKILRQLWWVFDPEIHFVMYTVKALTNLLKKHKFKILKVETNIITPWFLPTESFHNRVFNKIVYLMIVPFQKFLFNHHFGDNIQVIVRTN